MRGSEACPDRARPEPHLHHQPERGSTTSCRVPALRGVGPLVRQKGEAEASLPFSLPSGPGRWVQSMLDEEAKGRSEVLCSWTWVNI